MGTPKYRGVEIRCESCGNRFTRISGIENKFINDNNDYSLWEVTDIETEYAKRIVCSACGSDTLWIARRYVTEVIL